MKKLVKIGVATVMACGLLATTNVLAVWVGGGQWNYGVGWTGTFGYSDYLHSTRSHTATVRHGSRISKDRESPEVWTQASLTKIPPTELEYFYELYWRYLYEKNQ